MKFSQRIGILPKSKAIQIGSLDSELKTGLWNTLVYHVFNSRVRVDSLALNIWHAFFKKRIEEAPTHHEVLRNFMSEWFFDPSREWYDIYDLIEYLISEDLIRYGIYTNELIEQINDVLAKESSGYRIIGNEVVQITSEIELEEIEEALTQTSLASKLEVVNIHLKEALAKLSDRINPDYRNSIKESISAVESIAKILANKPKATLNDALNALEGQLPIHTSLKNGFRSIYGYTGDSDGIRHSLMEKPSLDFDDAKFMLVSCSAFVNYLITLGQKTGILID